MVKLLLVNAFVLVSIVNTVIGEEDIGLSVVDLIKKNEYPVETHSVETEDGYILEMQRIPMGVNCGDNCGKAGPVLLMHCLLTNAAIWVESGPTKGLAYLLADEGYDVWLGNARGTPVSKQHKTLNPQSDEDYWNFGWHEIGIYDLPAKIDYILKETEEDNLYYIGSSQGATVYFVMVSEKPEYNKKIRLSTVMAPAVYMSNMENRLVKLLAREQDVFLDAAQKLELKTYMPPASLLVAGGQMICVEGGSYAPLCHNILFYITGESRKQLNKAIIPLVISNLSPEASKIQFLHYFQIMNHGKFCKFNYSSEINQKLYGSELPPNYNLKNAAAPVAIFYAPNDALVAEQDVLHLSKQLPNVKLLHKVEEEFNHIDFLWGNDVVPLVYNKIFKAMKENM